MSADTARTLAWVLGTLAALALVITLNRHLSSKTRNWVADQVQDEKSRNRWLTVSLVLLVLAGSLAIAAVSR